MNPDPDRILITRLSHIGDCVFTMPLACAVRERFSKAKIVWAVESPSHQLLEVHPCVDEVIRIPKGWLKSPRAIARIRRQLQGHKFDVSLDPQGLTKSSLLGWLSKARHRIGLSKPWSGELAPWTYTQMIAAERDHIVPRTLELLRPWHVDTPNVRFGLPIPADARIAMDDFMDRAHLGCGYLLINPGASWQSKCWEMDRFGAVAKELGRQFGLTTVVVWASKTEEQQAEEIIRAAGGHAIKAPRTSLLELAALSARARLFVSADTGPLHLAAASGAKCVGLYGATLPSHCGAWGRDSINLQQQYGSGTRRQRRRANNNAMRAIQIEHVLEACVQLLRREDGKQLAA